MAHDYDTPGASEPSYIVGTNNLVDPAIGLKTNRHIPRTRLERLKDMKKGLEAKLKEVNDAIEALESNPELTAILKKLEKVNV